MTPANLQNISQDAPLELLDVAVRPMIASEAGQEKGIESYLSARALLAFVFMLLIFTLATRQIIDPDFWWHLKTGQYLVESGSIPKTDIFSTIFAGKKWITHEWLAEVFIYSVYRAVGFGGLIVTFSLLITAGFTLTYRQCARRAGHVYIAGAAVLLGALAAGPTWGVRPQVFSFLFASVFLVLLERSHRDHNNRSTWWLVPLMALWVNLHAGFAVGLVLILLMIIGRSLDAVLVDHESFSEVWHRVRPLVWVLLSCGLAVLANPSGARLYSYPFETLTSQAMMKFIEEWRTPNFHELMFQPLALLILATFSALALSGKRITFTQVLLLMSTAWAMLRSGRNAPFFVLVAVPIFAEHSWIWLTSQRWGRWLTKPEVRAVGAQAGLKIALNILLLVVVPLGLMLVRVQRTIANQPAVEAQKFPRAALEFMRANKLSQPVYNEYHWGGYLIWKLYPDYRVFIDGRADVYGDAFFSEFMATHAGEPQWSDSLDKYGVRTVLITPDAALASLLRQDQRWQKVFEDNQAVIFTRR
ncbi:MAG: hypothetical protein JWM21_2127 [Acidobacteria bacterium]|nr:hypothetical protein [Acidobacteriota bacterium]